MEISKNRNTIKEEIKKYYGKVLAGTKDLKTSACCAIDSSSRVHQEIVKEINQEIVEKFYGCGSPLPSVLDGCVVLDLGCGTGRDVYIASKLVGPEGYVIGVDMTDEQLDVAHRNVEYQTQKFGFEKPNVKFMKGYIEDLKSLGISDNSVDVVISNCVINLSPDKEAVFLEIFRVLKPGGELYFSDIYADRRIPGHLKQDPVLVGECLTGSLYIEDFRRILQKTGCHDYRIISHSPVTIKDGEIREKLGTINFYSTTVRAFKLDDLEDICEDYGQEAVYLGTIRGAVDAFEFDNHHKFIALEPARVCGNTASMLKKTRFSKHFTVTGDRAVHFGAFDCKTQIITDMASKMPVTVSGMKTSCC